jgi:hypothetical protein
MYVLSRVKKFQFIKFVISLRKYHSSDLLDASSEINNKCVMIVNDSCMLIFFEYFNITHKHYVRIFFSETGIRRETRKTNLNFHCSNICSHHTSYLDENERVCGGKKWRKESIYQKVKKIITKILIHEICRIL